MIFCPTGLRIKLNRIDVQDYKWRLNGGGAPKEKKAAKGGKKTNECSSVPFGACFIVSY